ncbi:M15 family metallopeptidase [Microbacterium caowuchunii]|uniref:D-alanyl-D-alanine carboxypeptidase-like core domain-containing protein n=1 Tax=Microbacterium caowuchunii TaxID=2614638 RepID=A0A5N0TM31_9MICO|nr:M15 family metallopeptidase [Microbacterium caowuchunii]KAA9134409.1 hypothetical protein F6B40_06465 [Microbacterium caowuchunii]
MNAATALGLPERAQVLGVMAAMGESGLRNITYGDWETAGVTNPNGTRTTSIGLFQQQTSWGSTDERLNPTKSATLFYQRLAKLDGWETLPASQAIHRVQINSDPNHYSKWEAAAEQVTAALTVPCAGPDLELAAGPREWGGYENGKIPTSALARVPWAPEMRLRADAARSLTKLNAAFRQTFGYDLPLNDGYRDYAGQVEAKRIYGAEAATPGSSNHGWAIAIDAGTYTHMRISFDSATYSWLTTNGARYGWVNPDWAKPGGTGPDEAWHWEYHGTV